uniref:FNIP repeat-containing protein n=1 Tax=viral metagenome TaxID=1070528 RepID=A0A6C0CD62_9ZZZZ
MEKYIFLITDLFRCYLSDKELIYLTSTSKKLEKLKEQLYYNDKIACKKIMHLPYNNNFRCVVVEYGARWIPKNVKFVYYRFATYERETPEFLFSKITHLELDDYHQSNIKRLPPNLSHLILGKRWTEKITCDIPLTVTHIAFGNRFNRPLEKYMTKMVTHLSLGKKFNQTIEKSTLSLVTHLTMSANYDRSIDELDLSSIIHLTFGYNFNRPFNNVTLTQITHLTFVGNYNQPIKNSIPSSVTHLEFGNNFNQPLNDLPLTVKNLTLAFKFNHSLKDCGAVTNLTLNVNSDFIPIDGISLSVTHLTFGFYFDQIITGWIPESVTHLKFGTCFNKSVKNIPSSVTHLYLGVGFKQPRDEIPKTCLFVLHGEI